MINNEPPNSKDVEKSAAPDQDWFRSFCKHLELNYVPGCDGSEFDLPDYQIPTLKAVLTTLVESGMVTDAIWEKIHDCIANDDKQNTRTLGLGKGRLTIVSDDDDHLDQFEQYMP